MSPRSLAVTFAALLTSAPIPTPARPGGFDTTRCPMQQQIRALGSVASAKESWRVLHGHYRLYGACDVGPVSEGYSETIATLLVFKWGRLEDLAGEARRDPPFLQFVLDHLDATVDPDLVESIRRGAESDCPPAHRALCGRIAGRTRALQVAREMAARR